MAGDTPLAAPQPAPCTGRLAGRTALVVGGGADGPPRPGEHLAMGNGRAIALRLAAEGATVAVTDVDLGRAEETVAALAGPGLAIRADVGDPEDCRAAVRRTVDELGSVDIVVLNAAVSGRMPLRAQTLEDWERSARVNVQGHWVTAQAALGPMLDRGRGVFVFVGSTTGGRPLQRLGGRLRGDEGGAARRHAPHRRALRAQGIRSNAVVLGVIDSTMVRREYGSDADRHRFRGSVVPMGRRGPRGGGGRAALASDDASYVNGHRLVVDGGVTAARSNPPAPTPGPERSAMQQVVVRGTGMTRFGRHLTDVEGPRRRGGARR